MSEALDPVRNPAKGRPMGAAICWLTENDQVTKKGHMDFRPSFGQRAVTRVGSRDEYGSDFTELESHERDRRPGEESEPELDL